MKKVLLLLWFLPLFAQGQVSKGSKFLGGNISYTLLKYDYEYQRPTHHLTSEFYYGNFISNSVAMGPMVSLDGQWVQTINPITNLFEARNSKSLLGGIFIRKYFELSEKFFFAMEGFVAAGVGRNSNPNETESVFNYRVAATPMFIFQPAAKWAFLARIGEVSIQERSNVVNLTRVQVNLGQVSFGVNYFLNQEKNKL